jgi:hypothetical protein
MPQEALKSSGRCAKTGGASLRPIFRPAPTFATASQDEILAQSPVLHAGGDDHAASGQLAAVVQTDQVVAVLLCEPDRSAGNP